MATKARDLSRNHIKLSYWHIGLAIFYTVAGIAAVMLLDLSKADVDIGVYLLAAVPVLHLILAWGARVKSEISRQVSILVGFAMFMAVPVGTIISLAFYLPLTDWGTAELADLGRPAGRS
jgi:hypothetical protein